MFYLFSICNASPDPDLSCDSQVQYCCQDHKELHFPAEQDQPYPFIVKYRPEVGRYMVASRYIPIQYLLPNHAIFSSRSRSQKGGGGGFAYFRKKSFEIRYRYYLHYINTNGFSLNRQTNNVFQKLVLTGIMQWDHETSSIYACMCTTIFFPFRNLGIGETFAWLGF